jgi:uncharacterized protein YlxW (UPF0749 family)
MLLAGIAVIFQLLLVILMLVLYIDNRKWKRKYRRLMRGISRQENLDEVLMKLNDDTFNIQTQLKHVDKQFAQFRTQFYGRLGLVRFHALNQQGNDLSFSMALLNEQGDGVVLTSLYHREQSYAFAKPIAHGDSEYPLSEEERKAIAKAMDGDNILSTKQTHHKKMTS